MVTSLKFAQTEDSSARAVMNDQTLTHLTHTLTQMTAKAADIRNHGKVAEAAFVSEFMQLYDLSFYESIDPLLLQKSRRGAL